MTKKNSNSLMLITGLIAGAATVLFIKSEKGQQMIDLALSKSDELKLQAQKLIDEGKTVVNEAVESGKIKLDSAIEIANDSTEDKISQFQNGIEKAKNHLAKA